MWKLGAISILSTCREYGSTPTLRHNAIWQTVPDIVQLSQQSSPQYGRRALWAPVFNATVSERARELIRDYLASDLNSKKSIEVCLFPLLNDPETAFKIRRPTEGFRLPT